MSKLYVFGIGGTGARVLKSLTMLLSAGVSCGVDTIVPIIIDPDDSGADLTRTVDLLKRYDNIRRNLDFTSFSKNGFFNTEISQTIQNYRLPLNNTRDAKFRDYLKYDTLSIENMALVNMLFSQKNLESDMKVGFRGNPNIGSVVLNQFAQSQLFLDFANNFQQGDKIFIISSIFGGTGASGFPLLAKTLRSNNTIPNFALINSAQIGAISVLPYFGVKQDNNSEVDSTTFLSKTKSALSYYFSNISNNNTVNALYYIADDVINHYENHEGGAKQKNNAHFVEMISALAVLDFALGDYSHGIVHKEFGIETNSQEVIFSDLGKITQNQLQIPLTQFLLFCKYMKEECNNQYTIQPWAKMIKFDMAFIESSFIKDVITFQNDFLEWLVEMNTNKRKLSFFELSTSNSKLFDIVKGTAPKKMFPLYSNYALYDHILNGQNVSQAANKQQQFMEMFYSATRELVNKKFNF